MTRRTYKSKKDTGGALDPRDMVINMDEKESVFNAFYIQNIKQTKREQSCMGASNNIGAASNRVRKRKYVKRLVKNVEPAPRESLSGSVFLTPDKSIRVNKAPDLFDQLLNSSPVWPEAKQLRKEDLYRKSFAGTPKQNKIYSRKKKPVAKRFNYSSSSSSASDKENAKNESSSVQNATDIISHELVIEKEVEARPQIDESINNIVKKLSLINKMKENSDSLKKSLKCNKNRLTNNLQSPLLKHSPLSSTPFTEKSRNKSIYKFSPIPMGQLDESAKYVTITEDDDERDKSIVFIPTNYSNSLKSSQIGDNVSNVSHTSKSNNVNLIEKSSSLFSSQANTKEDAIKNLVSKDCSNQENKNSNGIELSSIQTSEIEPFLGFNENNKENDSSFEENKEHSIIIPIGKLSKHSNKSKDSNNSVNRNKSQHVEMESSIPDGDGEQCQETNAEVDDSLILTKEFTVPSQSFLGFSKFDAEFNQNSESEVSKNDDSLNEQNSDIGESVSCSELNQDDEKQSSYDTCDSENSLIEEIIHSEPVVALERLDMSVFNAFYNKMPNYNSEEDSGSTDVDKELTEDNVSFESCEPETDQHDISYNTESDITSTDDNSDSSSENSPLQQEETMIENKENIQEDKLISFVTRRRRNEFTNNSTILVLDDSEESASENDKTVLSIKNNDSCRETVDSSFVNMNCEQDITLKEINKHTANTSNIANSTLAESRSKCIPARNSALHQETLHTHNVNESVLETKPGIILQPGKKWERSLSIYRRMTMANDHFDHSILDDEDLQHKGRKYRLSVIHTMEMQDKSSIHNESINNRRSTFVPKPSRSTIRIVKETSNRLSLSSTTVFEDLKGFLEDCDDTIIELSKLSIADERDITVVEKFNEECRIATARDYVLRRCNQTEPIPFDECYPDPLLKNCRKIGEGVYGEVYLWRAPDGRARVMKVVPIAGDTRVNGEQQKDFHEIISEIVIAMELSALRAPITEIEKHFDEGKGIDAIDLHSVENATDVFNEVLAVRCVYGTYPSRLLDLWELYDESRGSDNDNPAVLPVDQQYIVLELANAGQDLESYSFTTAEQAYALFLQVAFALAVGEESLQFEHRDLHWGNVLIAPTDQKYATFVLRGRLHRVARCGVAATIIDYSLSRVSLPLAQPPAASAALYNDLATDDGLFNAVGDYQFAVYRLMRDKLGNDWKTFEPYTNILWLHYTVDKMVTALRYDKPTSRVHKAHICKLKALRERILNYGSAAQFVLTDNEY